ncbi:MAG: SRPBCC family protein [Nitriliruptorales bacterium]
MRVEVSKVIDRPIADVFHWYADEHVRNHPRWNPGLELWLDSDAPIGVGTIIRRRHSMWGNPIEGTMEVMEFEPNRAMGAVIHDGPVEMRGRATFEAIGADQTNLAISAEFPESINASLMRSGMERSLENIKNLIEDEL